MQNNLRIIERAYFSWRDRNDHTGDGSIVSTLTRRESDCLITLSRGSSHYELSVRADGSVDVVRDGSPHGGYVLENVADIESIIHSLSLPLQAV